jgi:hypothetical protein
MSANEDFYRQTSFLNTEYLLLHYVLASLKKAELIAKSCVRTKFLSLPYNLLSANYSVKLIYCARSASLSTNKGEASAKSTCWRQQIDLFSGNWHDVEWKTLLLLLQKKKFEVRAVQDGKAVKRSFYTGSAERSRQLLLLCSSAHQFVMSLGPRLIQLRREQEEGNIISKETKLICWRLKIIFWIAERKRLRDCSLVPRRITSSDGDLLLLGSKALRSEQRESVISSASSNTTSGIVSDRVLSFDESEGKLFFLIFCSFCNKSVSFAIDDLEREIMINSPPAPIAISSVESLALEHLQDQEDPTDQEEEDDDLDVVDAPPAMSPGTPGAAEGSSQCSSSGSTIKHNKEVSGGGSSLELGYSHTPQSSALSESMSESLDYSVTSAQASAGAYPSRAPSVSLTLDSNSDYVQLPPLSVSDECPDEAEARFVSTRPGISVLTAHTVPAPSIAVPSLAAVAVKKQQPLVVTRNNYLDVRASGAMTTVYARQLSQSQIEQFQVMQSILRFQGNIDF